MPNPSPVYATHVGDSRANPVFGIAYNSVRNSVVACGSLNPFGGSINLASFDEILLTNPSSPSPQSPFTVFGTGASGGGPTASFDFQDIAIGPDGNQVFTGSFNGTLNFNNQNPANDLVSPSIAGAVYLVKLQPNGTHLWSTSFGGVDNSGLPGTNIGYGVAVDPVDNSVVVTGRFIASFTITTVLQGTVTLSNANSGSDIFIIKYNSSGVAQWAKSFGSTGAVRYAETGYGVAVDSSHNIYLTGGFCAGTINFGRGPLSCNGSDNTDPFVVQFDTNGNCLWSISFPNQNSSPVCPSGSYAFGSRVRINSSGSVYVSGTFNATAVFGLDGQKTGFCAESFLVSLTQSSGVVNWVDHWNCINTNTSVPTCRVLSVDASGNAICGGFFVGSTNMGSGQLNTIGVYDACIGTFDSVTGNCTFSTNFGVPNQATIGQGACIDSTGNIWMVLLFSGTLQLTPSISITSSGGSDWGIVELGVSAGIAPPNPCDFVPVYAPSSDGTVFTAKFGFLWKGVLPPGVSNILIRYFFPAKTFFPTPGVPTTPFLLLNFPGDSTAISIWGNNSYGFVYKVDGGDGPSTAFGLQGNINNWWWSAAWANASGVQIGNWCSDNSSCQPNTNPPGWVHIAKVGDTLSCPPLACFSSPVFKSNSGTISGTPYFHPVVTTIQTTKGPMQVVS